MTTQELIRARFVEVQASIEEIKGRTLSQRQKLQALTEKQAAMQVEIDQLSAEVHFYDPELFAAKRELATLAKALGGKTLSGGK